jgi:Domain of unknown function (DUF4389)
MKAGRIVMIVIGSLLALVGFGLLIGGVGAIIGYATQSEGGYFRTGQFRLASPTYAITSDHVDLGSDPGPSDWLIDRGALGTMKLEIDPADPTATVFAGIGPTRDVAGYLQGVSRDQIRDFDLAPDRVFYRRLEGSTTPTPPGDESFWVAQASGSEATELTWKVKSGDWTVVVMNADASRGVDLDARLGIKVGWFLPAAIVLAVLGLLLLAGGTVLAILGGRGLARAEEPAAPAPATGPAGWAAPGAPRAAPATTPVALGATEQARAPAPPAYPLRLSGRLDDNLSRGLWLVKWLLAIPHYIILVFLGIAYFFVTVIAFFAIVITGKYPRTLFDFNVGVLRWSWRVGYYSYSALGTDRYPPFTLARTDYPAELDVDYPERLSRGLVLVKWWLLAIPQYLVIGFMGTGWWLGWWEPRGRWAIEGGFGLVGLLVLFAGVALLFRGRYPTGIFDFVLGLNRWIYRVTAYATLMTDRYPPFRLDQGGDDPGETAGSTAEPFPPPSP